MTKPKKNIAVAPEASEMEAKPAEESRPTVADEQVVAPVIETAAVTVHETPAEDHATAPTMPVAASEPFPPPRTSPILLREIKGWKAVTDTDGVSKMVDPQGRKVGVYPDAATAVRELENLSRHLR